MLDDVLIFDASMFDNFVFIQPFFFVATIAKLFCEGDNVIFKI